MSDVPAKTSTRPSGLTLIQACDGSPFWFIPVGYSIAAMPRPVCLAMQWSSGSASWPTRCSGSRSPSRWSRLIAAYSGASSTSMPPASALTTETVDGSV